jgi:pimeloyl-ACP methyl ester carboxylesterase
MIRNQFISIGGYKPLRRMSSTIAGAYLLSICLLAQADIESRDAPWARSPWFEEVSFTTTIEPKVRIHVNAPAGIGNRPIRATRLIVFALPNGNTIEQTLGCKMSEGLDWHYDIQHVAAQVRLMRTLMPKEEIVLVCAEAPGLTWPNFCRNVSNANEQIRAMIDDWRRQFGTKNAKVTLTGHSGGGAFMFCVIDASDEIPDYIDRIAFLDANYSFDAAMHAAKLEHWLNGDDRRRLIVVAYDDREITFQGKKVVGPDGGTFRATGRMRDALGKSFELADGEKAPFLKTTGLGGRIHFYVHPNPENKILHTALVGEMNGLVHVETLGTPREEKWGQFGGPRAYTKLVQPEPTSNKPATSRIKEDKQSPQPQAAAADHLPPRPANAMGGAEFAKSAEKLSLADREDAILREITSGNFPGFLRKFKGVSIRGTIRDGDKSREVESTIEVMPDYLAIGSDDDFVRMPMTPQTAQRIADRFGCVLPTRKLVDAIDAQAEVRVAPHPMTEERESIATFAEHHQIIEKQREGKPLGQLITGIKKDIVLTPRIFEKPQRLAIYGWRQLNGQPIQPLTTVHSDHYVDYSHGVRLVRNSIEVDGKPMKFDELLADHNRCGLVSDEGSMTPPRYPTE